MTSVKCMFKDKLYDIKVDQTKPLYQLEIWLQLNIISKRSPAHETKHPGSLPKVSCVI